VTTMRGTPSKLVMLPRGHLWRWGCLVTVRVNLWTAVPYWFAAVSLIR
jgi:hypothetical protein